MLTLTTCADEAQWGYTLEYLFLDECASALKRIVCIANPATRSVQSAIGAQARRRISYSLSSLYLVLHQWALFIDIYCVRLELNGKPLIKEAVSLTFG